MQTWRAIEGFPTYKVSEQGEVRNRKTGKCLKPFPVKGYLRVNLIGSGGCTDRKAKYVHKLVAEAFIGPCPRGMEVNHEDGVKTNNRLDNLEYVTPKGNSEHAARLGLKARGERHGLALLTEKRVIRIRKQHAAGKYNVKQLAAMNSVKPRCIGKVIRGETWKFLLAA